MNSKLLLIVDISLFYFLIYKKLMINNNVHIYDCYKMNIKRD